MDAEDFLEADELRAVRSGPEAPIKESCDGCDLPITWIDAAWVCSQCTWCSDCAEGNAMVCPTCSQDLVRRARRTRAMG